MNHAQWVVVVSAGCAVAAVVAVAACWPRRDRIAAWARWLAPWAWAPFAWALYALRHPVAFTRLAMRPVWRSYDKAFRSTGKRHAGRAPRSPAQSPERTGARQ